MGISLCEGTGWIEGGCQLQRHSETLPDKSSPQPPNSHRPLRTLSFSLPYDAFDLDLIGLSPSDLGSSDFSAKVSEFFAVQFAKFGGRARVICNDSTQTIDVKWTKDRGFKEPKDRALELLQAGKIADAIPLLWAIHQEHPTDTDALYNLGISYSELGQIPKAIEILERLVELDPKHVHGLVGLVRVHRAAGEVGGPQPQGAQRDEREQQPDGERGGTSHHTGERAEFTARAGGGKTGKAPDPFAR